MRTKEKVLQELIELSHWLGEESRHLAILGEGNTSGKIDDKTFYVKASGCQLENLTIDHLVEVNSLPILELLDSPVLSDTGIKARMRDAMVDSSRKLLPSTETLFHAYLLTLPGVNFVGHTHPISVNAILCSNNWREATRGRLSPEEVACCGIAPVYIDYVNPGMALGHAVRRSVEEYTESYGIRPKAILLQNHGLIALGATTKEVQGITAMWDKTAKVLAATYQFGGPHYISMETAERFADLPEDDQRRKLIEGRE